MEWNHSHYSDCEFLIKDESSSSPSQVMRLILKCALSFLSLDLNQMFEWKTGRVFLPLICVLNKKNCRPFALFDCVNLILDSLSLGEGEECSSCVHLTLVHTNVC